METILKNATLVLPEETVEGSITFADGVIRSIDEGPSSVGEDVEGDYLIPGIVELHTDNLEKHVSPRPGVLWNPVSAARSHDAQIAAAGITTVFDAVTVGEAVGREDRAALLKPMIEGLEAAGEKGLLRADHLLHLRCEVSDPGATRMFEKLSESPLVKMISLMDHAPGQRQFADIAKYRQYYQAKNNFTDQQMDDHIAMHQNWSATYADPHRREIVALAKERGYAIASHDDETIEHVEESAAFGITIAEFPTTLPAAECAAEHGMKILMGGPNLVRGKSHSGNVSAGDLADRDLLHILSSDYMPVSLMEGVFRLTSKTHGWHLPKAVATVTSIPAAAVGLHDRGEIVEGKRADLVQVALVDGLPIVRAVWREGKRVI
ncbi:MAG: alpha-D-ribose 1-methylphosphonate 5-triphosphate diphosphatase [Alphaproteobacteria bacterium]|nr:alpha-D-ribose 1-methylphosphonate 5-triphosphate diphosphatase [Alphaproteobacteria bacterium]